MSSLLDLLKMRLLLLWSLPNIYLSFVSVICLYIIYRHMKFIKKQELPDSGKASSQHLLWSVLFGN